MKAHNRFAIFAVTLAVLLFVIFWLKKSDVSINELSFIDISGKPHQISEYRGKPVLVVFWATDCPGCISEMPNLVKLYHRYASQGLTIVGVAMPYDSPDQIKAMQLAKQLPYTITWDRDAAITSAFGNIRVTPTSFLIGPDGGITMRKIGALNMNDLQNKLRKMGINPA